MKYEGLVLGSWNVICQRCGFKRKHDEITKDGSGLLVCRDTCLDPEELVYPSPKPRILPWTRPEVADNFIFTFPVSARLTSVSGTGDVGSFQSVSLSTAMSGVAATTGLGSLTATRSCRFTSTSFAVSTQISFDVVWPYLYIVSYASDELRIYDITDPESPVLKSTTSTTAGTNPSAIRVKGSYAYITYQTTAYLAVWDISNPVSPSLSGSVSVSGAPTSVAVHPSTDYCYVGNGGYSLSNNMKVVNVATPTAPSVSGTWVFNITNGSKLRELRHDGTYLYATGNYNSVSGYDIFCIINTTAPATPVTTGTLTWPTELGSEQGSSGLEVDGNYAYVDLTLSIRFKVVDISTKSAPSEVGSLSWTGPGPAGGGSRLAKRNNIVYRAQNNGTGTTCYSVDVTTPASPTQSTSYSADGDGVFDVAIESHYLIYMTGTGGQKVYIWCLT